MPNLRSAPSAYTTPIRWMLVYNDTDETIPPYGVMLAKDDVDSEGRIMVIQPDADGLVRNILFNGSVPIPPNSPGQAHNTFPAGVAYEGYIDVPTAGMNLGTTAGSWLLSTSIRGFVCIGGTNNSLTNVMPADGYSPTTVEVRNDTGQDLAQYSIVGLQGPLTTPQQNFTQFTFQPAFSGRNPGTIVQQGDPGPVGAGVYWLDQLSPPWNLHQRNASNTGWNLITASFDGVPPAGTFAVTQMPLADGETGAAVLCGSTLARLIVNQLTDTTAGAILDNNLYLSSGRSGATIIWRDPVTFVQVSGAADNGHGVIRITTAAAHNLSSGAVVSIYGIVGTTEANRSGWVITVVDSTHFDLQGSTFSDSYISGGFVLLVSTAITGASQNSDGLTQVTAPNHHLTSGDNVLISGVSGSTGANGDWIVDVVDANTFTLRGAAWQSGQDIEDNAGSLIVNNAGELVVASSSYAGGGLATKVIWAEVLVTGTAGGYLPNLTDVNCAATGLTKSYGYFQA